MTEFVDRLREKTRREIRYTRGMQCMHRERYIEYCHDMQVARESGDIRRAGEIVDDLRAFTGEMWRIMAKQRSAYERLVGMQHGHATADDFSADTATPRPPSGDIPGPTTLRRR